ncbi:hypothetical protein [Pseudomonas sp. SDO52101_S400]
MNRQDDLNIIWKRIFWIFIALLLLAIAVTYSLPDYKVPFIVCIAGNIGGYVGFHRRLSILTDPEIENLAKSWFALILPSFIGGILAGLLYLLFLSGVIRGDLFPVIVPDDDPKCLKQIFNDIFCQHAEGYAAYAKLLFWSFVAGFNQDYVVDLIENIKGTDKKADER